MATLIQRINRYRWLAILLGIVFLTIQGCYFFPEATFTLASDSRLPKWVTTQPGVTQADVSLTMNYYVMPWGRSAKFILQDKNRKVTKNENGKMICRAPFELENPPKGFPSGYPLYEAITVNGVTEIIEHRKMEPKFYVTNDTRVWKQYESMGC